MGRGSRNQTDATLNALNLRPSASRPGTVPAWAAGLPDTPAVPAASTPAQPAVSGNDAIRQLLANGRMQAVGDVIATGPEKGRTKDDRRQARRTHVRRVMDAATLAAQDMAASDDGMRTLLKAYAQAPDYSFNNLITAAAQLEAKGVDPSGLKFSRTAWEALGCEIKPGFEEPRGDQRGSDWDTTYAVTMFSPTKGRFIKLSELDENGDPKQQYIPGDYTTFTAYHQDAVQAKGGGPRPELPTTPWANATGSVDDARQLMSDLQRICAWERLTVVDGPVPQPARKQGVALEQPRLAAYDHAALTITVDPSAGEIDRSVAVLAAVAEHVGRELDDKRAEKLDLDAKALNRAAAESTKYVIASLYGLDSDEQTFPHLSHIAADRDRMRTLNGEVHHRVGKILDYLDPRREAKAKHAAQVAEKRVGERRAKREAQKGSAKAAGARRATA